jgi:DNA-binding response OmpR family regulator
MAESSTVRPKGLNRVNVLILDDDSRVTHIVRDILLDLGFGKVYTARDGEAGLRLMQAHKIDLIITDWEMEPMNGLAFVRFLRGSEEARHRFVPIIMLTGQAESEDVQTARDAGINEFVVKPFTVRRLTDKLRIIVENPRDFVLSRRFRGPDRRRKASAPAGGMERRRPRKVQEK